MDIINILPDSVANQIAAGEVVDRPAGAVKEMLENSMDAGASQIDLVIKDAGRTLIQVVDNGCGMSDSDARLCFERHATSKIHQADDLYAIHTMGFRGEALASIAAIAQVEMRTRQHDSELGTQVVIEGSHIVDQHPTVCPAGTSLSVKNLFFNVPARRNFLKKDSIELSHIEEIFRRITLIHHDLSFSFSSNGRLLYDLKGGTLLQRIAGLFGNCYKERLYAVEEQTDVVKIRGFVSRPEFSRMRRGEQYIFVNGRFIKHAGLSAAVERAYGDLLPDHAYPSYFIGLTVDPAKIDVNIHPTKTEVKFVDEHGLIAILRSAVKKALGQFALATELSFDTPEEFNLPPMPKGYTPSAPSIAFNPDYNPFHAAASQTRMKLEDRTATPSIPDEAMEVSETAAETREKTSGACLLMQGRYIVTALSSGLAIIDRQRAMERVAYHRFMSSDRTSVASQTLMFPVQCRFSAADSEMLGELLPDLQTCGFDIAPIGQTSFVVSATPSALKDSDLQQMLDQMLADYKNSSLQKFSNRTESLCASLARQMSRRVASPLTQEEMQQLVADLFACPMAEVSPSGKRTIIIVKPEEILK